MELDTTHSGIIVFSRMKSKRLPGKALMKIGGVPLVERVIRRAQLTGFKLVLATSNTKADNALEDLADSLNVNCYRGSEENVLERAYKAAIKNDLKVFARLCGDRPLFSLRELKFALEAWLDFPDNKKPDLITNQIPEKSIRGLTTEIIKTSSLHHVLKNNPNKAYQEHLTLGIYENQKEYKIQALKPIYSNLKNHSGFAIDTREDFNSITKLISVNPQLDFELETAASPALQNINTLSASFR